MSEEQLFLEYVLPDIVQEQLFTVLQLEHKNPLLIR